MKQHVLIVLLTLVLLAAGFLAGQWTERRRPLPPPPMGFMGELDRSRRGPPPDGRLNEGDRSRRPPPSRAEFEAELERLRPQIEEFRAAVERIEAEFRQGLVAVLTPMQRETYGQRLAPGGPESPSGWGNDRPKRPTFHVVDMVVVALRLDWLARELALDEAQREKVRALLLERRTKFLALADTAPLPSMFLNRMAPTAERLAEPKP